MPNKLGGNHSIQGKTWLNNPLDIEKTFIILSTRASKLVMVLVLYVHPRTFGYLNYPTEGIILAGNHKNA